MKESKKLFHAYGNWNLQIPLHPPRLKFLNTMKLFMHILTTNPTIAKVEPDPNNPEIEYATAEIYPPLQEEPSIILHASALLYDSVPYYTLMLFQYSSIPVERSL